MDEKKKKKDRGRGGRETLTLAQQDRQHRPPPSKVTSSDSDLRDQLTRQTGHALEAANPTHFIPLPLYLVTLFETPAETLTTQYLAQVNLLEG